MAVMTVRCQTRISSQRLPVEAASPYRTERSRDASRTGLGEVISAILLAAGSSRRMGQPKLLLELAGKTLIRQAAERALAAPVDELIVVVGPNRGRIESELTGTSARLIDNP